MKKISGLIGVDIVGSAYEEFWSDRCWYSGFNLWRWYRVWYQCSFIWFNWLFRHQTFYMLWNWCLCFSAMRCNLLWHSRCFRSVFLSFLCDPLRFPCDMTWRFPVSMLMLFSCCLCLQWLSVICCNDRPADGQVRLRSGEGYQTGLLAVQSHGRKDIVQKADPIKIGLGHFHT